jgi:X-X-X-Leu-X-X-Gly heptad repeat protein
MNPWKKTAQEGAKTLAEGAPSLQSGVPFQSSASHQSELMQLKFPKDYGIFLKIPILNWALYKSIFS